MLTRNWPKSKLTNLGVLLLLVGCSFFKGKGNERVEGHHRLYSDPEAPKMEPLAAHQRRLVIVATNDWQGNLEPKTEVAKDQHHPQEILMSVGGVDIYARYLNILRHLYPDQVVTVDAGNSLGGTLAARTSGAEAVLDAFQQLNYDAIGFSSKDLAAGPSLKKGTTSAANWIPPLMAKSKTPVLLTNLIDLHTTKPVEWGPTVPQLMKEVNGVKIGFIGLLGHEKLDSALMNGLYIEPTMQALLRQSRALRLKGAEVIVMLAYGGIQCGQERAEKNKIPLSKVNFDAADSGACNGETDLAKFIQTLPAGMVDVIVTGGGPSKVANIINGIPVVQAFSSGSSFSRVDLIYDRLNKRIQTSATKIHQPIRLCHRFFKETQDCYTEDMTVDHRELIPATYLGQEIAPDKTMSMWHQPWRQQADQEARKIVKVQVLREKMAQNLRESLGTDVGVTGLDIGNQTQPYTHVAQRDLWRIQGGDDQIRLLLLPGAALAGLRDYLDSSEGFQWSQRVAWEELETQTQVLIAMPEALWNQQVELWVQVQGMAQTSYLAPKLVADTAILHEIDTVNTFESGRDRP